MTTRLQKTLSRSLCALLAVAALGACEKAEVTAGSWPQWRGPKGTGVSAETGLPVSWNAEEGIRWGVKLPGTGISSPIVGNDVVYLSAGEAAGEDGKEQSLIVLALDLATGAMLWKTEVVRRPEEKLHYLNRAASATPAADGKSIFVYFGSHLAALSVEGKLLWVQEIYDDYLEYSHYGTGSSLAVAEDVVVVFRDREHADKWPGWLAAYSKDDGREVWRKEWTDSCCSYATPITINFANQTEVLVVHAGSVISYHPATGEELWQRSVPNMWQPVASPVIEDDLLCVASGAHNRRQMTCWQLEFKDGKRGIRELWTGGRTVPATASPILYNRLFFTVHEKGFTRSYDSETGNELWRARLSQDQYHASPVAGDGKIYAASYEGTVSVFEASHRYRLLSENALPEGGVLASPAIADGCLLVRTSGHLYCIEGTDPPVPTAS